MAVSVAIREIFSVKEWRDLENQVRCHSRSLKMMPPFDRPYATFYWSAMVNTALPCTIFELFDAEYYRDLEIWVRGHSRSLKLVPFDSLGTVSYLPSIVTMAISVDICEIFSVKEWCDLENSVMVCSRSLQMAPFDRSHTSSYSPSIVTKTISSIICEIQRVIGWKSRNFYTPPRFSAPIGTDHVGSSWRCLMLVKLEWLGYHMVKKLWQYVKSFSSDTGMSRTDRRTDRQIDRIATSISRVSVLTCDKNVIKLTNRKEANNWKNFLFWLR